jgi:hypothetical protein
MKPITDNEYIVLKGIRHVYCTLKLRALTEKIYLIARKMLKLKH